MPITKENLRRIRKYAKLRGGSEPALNYKTLKKIYVGSNDNKRKLYDKEMNQYFKAIEDKKVEKGQSILHMLVH